MMRIAIFGNSGSGKSTLAKRYSDRHEKDGVTLSPVLGPFPFLSSEGAAWQTSQPYQAFAYASGCDEH